MNRLIGYCQIIFLLPITLLVLQTAIHDVCPNTVGPSSSTIRSLYPLFCSLHVFLQLSFFFFYLCTYFQTTFQFTFLALNNFFLNYTDDWLLKRCFLVSFICYVLYFFVFLYSPVFQYTKYICEIEVLI